MPSIGESPASYRQVTELTAKRERDELQPHPLLQRKGLVTLCLALLAWAVVALPISLILGLI
jgi:hypothetical protein